MTGHKASLAQRLHKIKPIQCLVKFQNRLVDFVSNVEALCQIPILSKYNIKKLSNQEICDLHDGDLQSAIKTFNRVGDNIFNSTLTSVSETLNKNRFEIKYIVQADDDEIENGSKDSVVKKLTRVKVLKPTAESLKKKVVKGSSEPNFRQKKSATQPMQKSKRVPNIKYKRPLRTTNKPRDIRSSYSHEYTVQYPTAPERAALPSREMNPSNYPTEQIYSMSQNCSTVLSDIAESSRYYTCKLI